MSETTPFLHFEDIYHRLFAVVEESSQKLIPVAAGTVAELSTIALYTGFLEFCSDQRYAISKLRPTLMTRRVIRVIASGEEINDSFEQLVGHDLITAKECARLSSIARSRGLTVRPIRIEKHDWLSSWADTSEFLFDLAIKVARQTASPARLGLNPKRKNNAKLITAIDRLLIARFDNLA